MAALRHYRVLERWMSEVVDHRAMSSPAPGHPITVIRAADLDRLTAAAPYLRSGIRSGQLVRVRRGAYVAADEWSRLDRDARYFALVQAGALALGGDAVLSHESAAAVWGLPIIGSWPSDIHLLVERANGGRSYPGVRRHAVGIDTDHVTVHEGFTVTTLERTVVDLAATSSLYSAVATVDAAIHVPRFASTGRVTKGDLLAVWERMLPFRGFARARRVIDFADERSGSTSESASRVSIACSDFPHRSCSASMSSMVAPSRWTSTSLKWMGSVSATGTTSTRIRTSAMVEPQIRRSWTRSFARMPSGGSHPPSSGGVRVRRCRRDCFG